MVTDLKSLKAFLKLCREQGITEATLNGVGTFKLGELPEKANSIVTQPEADKADPYANFPAGELTNEQLMYYSSGGVPGEEPEGLA